MEKRTMGALMSALRKSKGMTQQDVADRLGVSNKTVSKWECDDGYPDISMLPAIAEIYGVSVDELLKGEIENDERQEKSGSAEKCKRQIERLVSSAYEKFKNTSVIALVFALLSVVFGFLLKNIFDDYLYGKTASLIAFAVSIVLSTVAIVLEWFAGSKLLFSLSGDDVEKCIDKTATYLKKARNFIVVAVGLALIGIFGSGAVWVWFSYDIFPPLAGVCVGVGLALIIVLALFFFVGSRFIVHIDNEKIKAEASYGRKTALGLIVCTLCTAALVSGTIVGIFKLTTEHTVKFENEKIYNDFISFAFGHMYPLIEKDEEKLTVTVVNSFDILPVGDMITDVRDPEYEFEYIEYDCGDKMFTGSNGEEILLETRVYKLDSKENMEKFIDEYCIDDEFLSKIPEEMIFNRTIRTHRCNYDKLTVKYSTGNFGDISGIFAMSAVGICLLVDGVYIIVRRSKNKKAK